MENLGRFDVIVIGAGVMGSSTAYEAAKRGQKVLLIEQFDFLHNRGSSHGESRTIRATYSKPYYCPMVIESEKLWRDAESEIGYKVYFKTQQMDLGPVDNSSLHAVIANCEKHSLNHQILDRHRAKELFAGKIAFPDDWTAVVTELGGVLKPTKAVAMFQTLAIKHGAVLKDKTEIVNLVADKHRGGILVSSRSGETFWGKKCVVTAGAWVSKLIQKVSNGGTILPIQPLEINVFYWKIKEGHELDYTIEAGFPTFASYGEPHIFGTPAMEYPDLIKVVVDGGRNCDADKRTWRAGTEGTTMVIGHLKEWIRSTFGDRVDWEDGPVITQSCLYSMTPDEDYIIDFLGGGYKEDVVVAGGFSGHGFKMAPLVGRILADLAISGKAAAEQLDEQIKHFKLRRFEKNLSGIENVKTEEDPLIQISS